MEILEPHDGNERGQLSPQHQEWRAADELSILCSTLLSEREKTALLADHPDVTDTAFVAYLEQVIDRTWLWLLNDGQYGSEDPEWLAEHWGRCPSNDAPSDFLLSKEDSNPVLTITSRGRQRIGQLSRDRGLSDEYFAGKLPEILDQELITLAAELH
jgi:hypothetical protein